MRLLFNYLKELELPVPFIKKENSVLPISIQKHWTKNLLLSFENEVFSLKKGNPIFRLNLDRD